MMAARELSDMGEFRFIEKIRSLVQKRGDVKVGIGDDAAVLRIGKGRTLLFTTDMILEGKHFLKDQATPFEIGWKAMAVNVSDIAAMGGVPTYAVVAAGLPSSLSEKFLRELYRGMSAVCRRFGIALVGGDTNASERIVLAVSLLGQAPKGGALLRSSAKPGDAIFVTGSLGGSYASKKHLRFIPRIRESQFLAAHGRVHAMMDISDGLGSDIFRLTSESRAGACLYEKAIPVSPAAKSVKHALTDGEDFELLFTVGAKDAARLLNSWPKRLTGIHCVGHVTARSKGVKLLMRDGRMRVLKESGFDHYRRS